jgi:Na+/H+ antiporter NhaD/arsenite permease-like protein
MNQAMLAGGIFVITYAVIVSERIHRTLAALLGGMLMVLLGVVDQADAFLAVDLNVIFLLAGMMMIAYVMGETGIFQWLAVQAVRFGRGDPVAVMLIIAVITAVASALLDNVTVVVLIAPVALFIAANLEVNPVPFLITEVMASNIGGAATLIGDPPNILIGSEAGLSFAAFLVNMGPPVVVTLAGTLVIFIRQFGSQMSVTPERREMVLRMRTKGLISEPVLLVKTLVILGLVLIGFFLHSWLHLQPATIALSGATLLLLWTRSDPQKVYENIEWTTLLFFVGLFITVEALVHVGIIDRIAKGLLSLTAGNLNVTTFFILWFSAIASGIVDNIPYTATMIPVIKDLAEVMRVEPLWWALALGADLGGNLTLVGASANVVVANLAERSGYRLSFVQFLRYGSVVVLLSLLVASFWLWVRYLVFL